MREKPALLEQALVWRVTAHHRFLISQLLAHIDYLDEAIARVSEEIAERMRLLKRRSADGIRSSASTAASPRRFWRN
jgi:transposase